MPVFRRRRLVLLTFLGIFLGAVLGALLLPRKYEAEMKILLNRERADVLVTPDSSTPGSSAPVQAISEEEINSEVALLKSQDLLGEVAHASHLDTASNSHWERLLDFARGTPDGKQAAFARAIQGLEERLTVEPLKKTNLIRIAYAAHDPQTAALVLQNLATLYQEKHAAVHRPPGTFSFFDEQTARYRDELAGAEAQLTDFDRDKQLVAPDSQKQLVLQQLSQFEAELEEDSSNATSAAKRAEALQAVQLSVPARQTTQTRRLDNAQLLAQLESTLLSLELKRSEMLMKYAPEYPPVQEVDAEIVSARKSIEQARQTPIEDVTTDRVPAQDWIATELVRAETERAEYTTRAANMAKVVRRYEDAVEDLDEKGTHQADLVRNVRSAEDNYLLYMHKREEARISDELDSKRIVNVSIAEAPTIPALPTLRLGWVLVGGFFTASVLSVGTAYASDRLDPSFRTPEELSKYLDVKVLAAIPASTEKHAE